MDIVVENRLIADPNKKHGFLDLIGKGPDARSRLGDSSYS